jgi:hypothetical protein
MGRRGSTNWKGKYLIWRSTRWEGRTIGWEGGIQDGGEVRKHCMGRKDHWMGGESTGN